MGWAMLMFLSVNFAWASGFHISKIGNIDTGGQQLSHWWYSGFAPSLHGEATPGAEVTIDIDGQALAINADSSGNWDFQPAAMTAGDHQVKVSGDGSAVNFTLTIGSENVNWDAVGSGSAQTLPTVGTAWPTVLLLIFGLGVAGWGGKMVFNVQG